MRYESFKSNILSNEGYENVPEHLILEAYQQSIPDEQQDYSETETPEVTEPEDDSWEITKGFKQGVDTTQATGYGAAAWLGDVTGSDDLRNWGLEGYKRNIEESQENAPRVTDYRDVHNLNDAFDYTMQAVGQILPSALTMMGTGGVGGVIAKKVAERKIKQFIANRGKEALRDGSAQRFATKVVSEAVRKGQAAGVIAGSVGMETGEIYGDVGNRGAEGFEATGPAIVGGTAAGMLDALPVMAVAKRFGFAGKLKNKLQKRLSEQGIARRVGEGAALGFVAEGSTEGTQTLIEEATKAFIMEENLPDDIAHHVMNAALTGAIGGGTLRGAASIPSVEAPKEQQKIDLVNWLNKDAKKIQEAKAQQQKIDDEVAGLINLHSQDAIFDDRGITELQDGQVGLKASQNERLAEALKLDNRWTQNENGIWSEKRPEPDQVQQPQVAEGLGLPNPIGTGLEPTVIPMGQDKPPLPGTDITAHVIPGYDESAPGRTAVFEEPLEGDLLDAESIFDERDNAALEGRIIEGEVFTPEEQKALEEQFKLTFDDDPFRSDKLTPDPEFSAMFDDGPAAPRDEIDIEYDDKGFSRPTDEGERQSIADTIEQKGYGHGSQQPSWNTELIPFNRLQGLKDKILTGKGILGPAERKTIENIRSELRGDQSYLEGEYTDPTDTTGMIHKATEEEQAGFDDFMGEGGLPTTELRKSKAGALHRGNIETKIPDDAKSAPKAEDFKTAGEYHTALFNWRAENNKRTEQTVTPEQEQVAQLDKDIANAEKRLKKAEDKVNKPGLVPPAIVTEARDNVQAELDSLKEQRKSIVNEQLNLTPITKEELQQNEQLNLQEQEQAKQKEIEAGVDDFQLTDDMGTDPNQQDLFSQGVPTERNLETEDQQLWRILLPKDSKSGDKKSRLDKAYTAINSIQNDDLTKKTVKELKQMHFDLVGDRGGSANKLQLIRKLNQRVKQIEQRKDKVKNDLVHDEVQREEALSSAGWLVPKLQNNGLEIEAQELIEAGERLNAEGRTAKDQHDFQVALKRGKTALREAGDPKESHKIGRQSALDDDVDQINKDIYDQINAEYDRLPDTQAMLDKLKSETDLKESSIQTIQNNINEGNHVKAQNQIKSLARLNSDLTIDKFAKPDIEKQEIVDTRAKEEAARDIDKTLSELEQSGGRNMGEIPISFTYGRTDNPVKNDVERTTALYENELEARGWKKRRVGYTDSWFKGTQEISLHIKDDKAKSPSIIYTKDSVDARKTNEELAEKTAEITGKRPDTGTRQDMLDQLDDIESRLSKEGSNAGLVRYNLNKSGQNPALTLVDAPETLRQWENELTKRGWNKKDVGKGKFWFKNNQMISLDSQGEGSPPIIQWSNTKDTADFLDWSEEEAAKKTKKQEKPAESAKIKLDEAEEAIDKKIDDVAAKLAAKFLSSRGTLNSGVDPEILLLGAELGALYVAKGAVKFAQYAKSIVDKLAEYGVKQEEIEPALKEMYLASQAKVTDEQLDQMDDAKTVRKYDLKDLKNVSITTGSMESDTSQTQTLGQTVQNESGTGGQGAGRNEPTDGNTGTAGVSNTNTTDGRTGTDTELREEESGVSEFVTGDIVGGRATESSESGLSTDGPAARESTEILPKQQAIEKQKAADEIPIKPGIENIRQTLPLQFAEQQEDVLFAENRLENHRGVMFTNGTGTGKTFTGLGIVKRMVRRGKDNILIVVPGEKHINDMIDAGNLHNLDITKLKNTKDAGEGVVITTYANFAANNELVNRDFDLIVTDEAHKLMSSADGKATGRADKFRALTGHIDGARAYGLAKEHELVSEIESINAELKALRNMDNDQAYAEMQLLEGRLKPLNAELEAKLKTHSENRAEHWAGQKTKVVFMSASPFSWRKSTDYAEGFLFDYPEGKRIGFYQRSGQDMFMIENFGYRIRYNKLTEPEADVDISLMEREFNEKLKKSGALSGRRLTVDKDYSREFILIDDAVGNKIDDGFNYLREHSRDGTDLSIGFSALTDIIERDFDYHQKVRLLEAIKAKHAIPRIKEHLTLGRKVVIFHSRIQGGSKNPFTFPEELKGDKLAEQAFAKFVDENPDIANLDLNQLRRPIELMSEEFGDDIVFYNGTVPKKLKIKNPDLFNAPTGPNIIMVQDDAGQEGISLHDTVGDEQRILITLGLPVKPTQSIQIEGRVFRIGQASNAVFEYFNTGTMFERIAFAERIATRAETAENLALGREARGLKEAFIQAFENPTESAPHLGQGIGGKAADTVQHITSEFEQAKTYYFAQHKVKGRRDQREGTDYYATPEPLGLKMVEWADIKPNDDVLEPSAGHGAIARFFPESANITTIEPSQELSSKLALRVDGKRVVDTFENHYVGNKYDAIVMNPPFGSGGKTAIDHLAKATQHLRAGGRVVALIPEGPAANKKYDNWLYGVKDPKTGERKGAEGIFEVTSISLPTVTFERAGTMVKTRVVVLEKHMNSELAVNQQPSEIEAGDINNFFDKLENKTVVEKDRSKPDIDTKGTRNETKTVSVTGIQGAKVIESENTRTGETMWLADLPRVSKEDWKNVVKLAKNYGGYWQRYKSRELKKTVFHFKTEGDALAFVEEVNGGEKFSKTNDEISGQTVNELKKELGKTTDINIVQTQDELNLPDEEGIIRGVYDPETGKITLVADNIEPGTAKDILRHEVVHAVLKKSNQYESALRALEKEKGTTRYKEAEQAAKDAGTSKEDMQEEILAYYVQNQPKLMWIKRLISKIKSIYKRLFGGEMNMDDVYNLVDSMAKNKATVMSDGRVRFSKDNVIAWGNFPNVLVQTSVSKVIQHPLHKKAKSGDNESAIELVRDLIKISKIKSLPKDAVVVPILAEEEIGMNKIPLAYAHAIGDINGNDVNVGIFQTNRTHHSNKNAVGRLLSRANFTGDIIAGRDYIIVDDIVTTGTTISELRHYIENNGGNVVMTSTLGYSRFSTNLAIKPDVVVKLKNKFNEGELNEILREFNIAGNIKSLTNSEGKYILSFSSLNSIRTKFSKERDDLFIEKNEGKIRGSGLKFSKASQPATGIRAKVNPEAPKKSMSQIYSEFKENLIAKFRQGAIDRYNSLLEMDKKLYGDDVLSNRENFQLSSWVLAKMSHASEGAVHHMLDYGRIKMNSDGAIDSNDDLGKSVVKVLEQLGSSEEINDFMIWIAANRAEKLKAEGRENLFTDEDIAEGKSFIEGKEELWNKVYEEFNQHQKDVLEIAQQSGIISEEQANDFANEMYVPFYRVMTEEQIAEGAVPGRTGSSGLSRAEAYKQLKGGKQNLGDLLDNTIVNWNNLISASLRNNAAKQALANASDESLQIATEVPKKLAVKNKSTYVKVDGKKVWYNIHDKLVYNSLMSLQDLGMNQGLMKVMRGFKRVFTTATTASPQFIIANFMRDSIQSAALGKKSMGNNAGTGFLNFTDDNAVKQRMIASGGAFSFGHIFADDPDAIRRTIDRKFKNSSVISDRKHIKDVIFKGWDRYMDMSNRVENANRTAIYEQALRDGKSHQQASFEARDLMDFSSRGEWAAIRILTDIVPFLNARLQGLDVMTRKGIAPTIRTIFGKGTDNDAVVAKRFSTVASAVAMASMALYMAYEDDEDFQELEDWMRDTYWFFKIGDNRFFIPKPFEIGAMGTMAERTLEQFVDDKATGELFRERFGHMLWSTFAFTPYPQAVKPIIDIYANKDSFTGRDIESQAMQKLSPENRSRPMTTSMAKTISSGLQTAFGGDSAATLSPVQIDYLIKNYLGWVGATISGFVDELVNFGERPEKYWYERQPIKRFYQTGSNNYTKYTTQFYDNMAEVNRIYADIRNLRQLGRDAEAAKLTAEHKDKLRYRRAMNKAARMLTTINKRIKRIQASKADPAIMRREIDALQQQKKLITTRFKDLG